MSIREIVIKELLRRDGSLCKACGKEFSDIAPPDIDHIMPRSRGGDEDFTNLQLLHAICNKKKSNKIKFELRNPGLSSNIEYNPLDRITININTDNRKGKLLLNELIEIKNQIIQCDNNISKASELLKIPRRRITYLMMKFNLPKNAMNWGF